MYLNYSQIKIPHIPAVGRYDAYRCTGEELGRTAVLKLQKMVPPTIWAMKMPKAFKMHVTKEHRDPLIRHEIRGRYRRAFNAGS